MTRSLTLSKGFDDHTSTFTVETTARGKPTKMIVSLQQDMNTKGDGIYWGLQGAVVLSASYSIEEKKETARLNTETPVRNGDLVQINGGTYKARVLGNFSDCVVFDPLAAI